MIMKTIVCLLVAVYAVNASLSPEDDVANLVNWKVSKGVIKDPHNGVFPKLNIEQEFTEFRESDKSLKPELGSI